MRYNVKSFIFALFGIVYTIGCEICQYIMNDSISRLSSLYRISENMSPENVDTKAVTAEILEIYHYINTSTILQVGLQWFIGILMVTAIFQAYKASCFLEVGRNQLVNIVKVFACVMVIVETGLLSMELLGATFLVVFLGIEALLSLYARPNYYHANFAFLEDE